MQDNQYPVSLINISIRQKTPCANSKFKKIPKMMPCLPYAFLAQSNFLLGNKVKSIDSKAVMQLNLVSFFVDATSNQKEKKMLPAIC